MLVMCPECEGQVSDKAYSCPHCGYPLKPQRTSERKKKYKKLPNGFGSVRKLSGNRRRPYAAYVPVTEYKDNGTAVNRKAIGYFGTYQEALSSLVEYNKKPYDVGSRTITFAEVFELYFAAKFGEEAKKKLSYSSMNTTRSGFNNLTALHSVPIASINIDMMQSIIDSSKLSHASLEHMVRVCKEVFRFAMARDIIDRDYAAYIKINSADDDEKGCPFTNEELATLWKHTDNQDVRITLIFIYTGFRISELKNARIEDGCFVGGIKTAAGKNRIVPIHPYIKNWLSDIDDFVPGTWRKDNFHPLMKSLGLSIASSGAKHTPHDCRHTFSWLADEAKMDPLSKHMIMGHSLGNDVETSVYGHRTKEELIKAMKKIKNKGKVNSPCQ